MLDATMGDEATGEAGGSAPVPGIDAARISRWFETHIGASTGELRFRVISGGLSNLTYEVTDGADGRWVLRRPPLGARLGSAHDMGREYRVITALAESEVPVSPALGFCEDEEVTGAPFYVMDFVEGPILRNPTDAEVFPEPEQRYTIATRVATTLAALHEVEPQVVGLADLGRHEGYIERQLARWQGQWEKSKTRELPLIEEVHANLSRRVPPQGPARIVHGDYRLDNLILKPVVGGAANESIGVAAVVDWELCTLGDPLADLGLLLVYWQEADDPALPGFEAATRAPGFPDRAEVARIYAEASGRDLADLDFYVALGYWKLAIILEGVLARFLAGGYGEKDPSARERFAGLVAQLAEAAAGSLRGT